MFQHMFAERMKGKIPLEQLATIMRTSVKVLETSGEVTQQELAARLQAMGIAVDQAAISWIESGDRPITDIEIVSTCKALKIKPADLFE